MSEFMINGQQYDWASIELGVAGAPIPSFTAIEYSDSQDSGFVHGKGRMPVGWRRGNYEAEGKMTLHREAYEALSAFFASTGSSLYGRAPFPITVSYAAQGKPILTDVLEHVLFRKRSQSMSQNAEAAAVELTFVVGRIRWNKVAP